MCGFFLLTCRQLSETHDLSLSLSLSLVFAGLHAIRCKRKERVVVIVDSDNEGERRDTDVNSLIGLFVMQSVILLHCCVFGC